MAIFMMKCRSPVKKPSSEEIRIASPATTPVVAASRDREVSSVVCSSRLACSGCCLAWRYYTTSQLYAWWGAVWGRRELGLAGRHHHSVCPSYQNLFGVFPSPVTHLVTFNSNRAKQKNIKTCHLTRNDCR